MDKVNELPILYSAPMVLSILDDLKTQTRRIVKPPRAKNLLFDLTHAWPDGADHRQYLHVPYQHKDDAPDTCSARVGCPYGLPPDRLWVKEAYRLTNNFDSDSATRVAERCLDAGYRKPWAPIQYEADKRRVNWEHTSTPPHDGPPVAGKLRPSIFMPRWASRITLEITGIRVEHLHDISKADAIAEGIERRNVIVGAHCASGHHTEVTADRFFFDGCREEGFESAVDAYFALWEKINGSASLSANPLVWVVEFKRIN